MTNKKERTCKYPTCHKLVPDRTHVFCGEHSKKMKGLGKVVGGTALALSSLLILPKNSE